MLDPVNTQHFQPLPKSESLKSVSTKFGKDQDLKAAEEEVASLYYQSSIASLAAPQAPEKNQAVQESEKKVVQKSWFGKAKDALGSAKDWLWGILGWGQKPPVSEVDGEQAENEVLNDEEDNLAGGIPQLQAPSARDNKKLSQTIADLNRELVNRLKDIAEFEEEMKKNSAHKIDKFIFIHLINSSINQKKLKEASSIVSQEHLLELHSKNKKLQKEHYCLVDAILQENKMRGVIKWINVGLTGITVGGTAIGFAFGGPLGGCTIGMPLSLLGKGITSLTEGILKYKNDLKTGDLVIIKQETRTNNEHKKDKLSEMQLADSDIATLLKKIRHHLDNQTRAERASFGRN